ncbi:hypothetical protein B0H13DRAFT_2325660 [Mycena leptocephala]|nr:hypothetical protein B0H13DRAFT_2325660 [Mycena leptocephala]
MVFNTQRLPLLLPPLLCHCGYIPPAMTVTRVFKTITDVAPFIVDRTTVFTFTPSPSTSIAFPTGTGL